MEKIKEGKEAKIKRLVFIASIIFLIVIGIVIRVFQKYFQSREAQVPTAPQVSEITLPQPKEMEVLAQPVQAEPEKQTQINQQQTSQKTESDKFVIYPQPLSIYQSQSQSQEIRIEIKGFDKDPIKIIKNQRQANI